MTDTGNYQQLKDTINESWEKAYPDSVPVDSVEALCLRVRNLTQDRADWAFNCRVLQKAYNELDKDKRELLAADSKRALELLGSIFYCGNFIAETRNEQELEMLMRKHGYFIETEAQFDVYCPRANSVKD